MSVSYRKNNKWGTYCFKAKNLSEIETVVKEELVDIDIIDITIVDLGPRYDVIVFYQIKDN
jgi:hypothetical protein